MNELLTSEEPRVNFYRLYILRSDRVAHMDEFAAVSDEEAQRLAERKRGGEACELWRSTKLVSRMALAPEVRP